MPFAKEPNRRGFMKMLAASPLLAQIAAQGLYVKSAAAMGLTRRAMFTLASESKPSSIAAEHGLTSADL